MPIYKANCIYGYFQKEVPVFVSKRLKYCPHGQCGVLYDSYRDNKKWLHLISYESIIFSYCPDTNEISFEWSNACPDYSRTTAKHVNAFCKEYVPAMTYQAIKRLYYEWKEEQENTYLKDLAKMRKEDEYGYLKNDKFLLRDF